MKDIHHRLARVTDEYLSAQDTKENQIAYWDTLSHRNRATKANRHTIGLPPLRILKMTTRAWKVVIVAYNRIPLWAWRETGTCRMSLSAAPKKKASEHKRAAQECGEMRFVRG